MRECYLTVFFFFISFIFQNTKNSNIQKTKKQILINFKKSLTSARKQNSFSILQKSLFGKENYILERKYFSFLLSCFFIFPFSIGLFNHFFIQYSSELEWVLQCELKRDMQSDFFEKCSHHVFLMTHILSFADGILKGSKIERSRMKKKKKRN